MSRDGLGGWTMTLPVKRAAGVPGVGHPFRPLDDLYSEFDRLVQSLIGSAGDGTWLPAADIVETDSAYVIEIELPGVRREDVDVELDGNELVVTGEIKERKREGLLRRRTRPVGKFEYRVTLPGDLRADEVEGSLAFGVLKLHVPKAQSTQHSKINVTESGG
jgi:HSP20 family protein